jgi:hypothetical protein
MHGAQQRMAYGAYATEGAYSVVHLTHASMSTFDAREHMHQGRSLMHASKAQHRMNSPPWRMRP